MSRETHFVVQQFHREEDGRIRCERPSLFASRDAAIAAAQRLSSGACGAIAFAYESDTEDDVWIEPTALAIVGEVIDQASADALPW